MNQDGWRGPVTVRRINDRTDGKSKKQEEIKMKKSTHRISQGFYKKAAVLAMTAILALGMLGCGSKPDAASTAAAGSTAAAAPEKILKVGITQYAPHPSLDNCREGIIAGLKEAGFEEGKNLELDLTNADGKGENASMIAQNYVAKKYDMIVAIATPSAMTAQAAAEGKHIPVVFSAVSDPVSAKLVETLEAPNRSTTGTSDALPLEKQMQMIRAFLPEAKKIGILYTTNEVNSQSHLAAFQALAPQYGFEIVAMGVNGPSDIPLAVDSLLPQVDCVNNFTDNNVVNNLETLISKANEKKIPVFGSEVEQVKNGCVASESIDYVELGRQTGLMAGSILKGQDVNTLAVKVISESKPVVNQAVLDMLGIQLPESYRTTAELVGK